MNKNVPGGKTHDKINIIVLFIVLLGLFSLLEGPKLPFPDRYLESRRITVFSLSYLFGTFFLSPDLDIKSGPYKRWGVLKVIWRPYQKVFGHRGVLHHPVLGPIILTLTLALLLSPLLFVLGLETARFFLWVEGPALFGLVLSMEVHYASDFVWGKIRPLVQS